MYEQPLCECCDLPIEWYHVNDGATECGYCQLFNLLGINGRVRR